MHRSLFSLASALTISLLVTMTSAGVAALSAYELEQRALCRGDTYHEIFVSVGMGFGSEAAENDVDNFCRSWIGIPHDTTYFLTTTPTTTLFPSTRTVDSTTEIVTSATSTTTTTVSETNYVLNRRGHAWKGKIQEEAAAAAAAVTPRAILPHDMILKARQADPNTTRVLDVSSLGQALSSACSCRMVSPLTTYLTSTAPAVTRTIGATFYQTVTLNNTVAGGVVTVTETVNVTSTIRPTGTGGGSSGMLPTHSWNHTISGTGTGTGVHTLPTYSHSSWNYTHGTGTGVSGWPQPTHNSTCLPCPNGTRNVTATITAFSTTFSTETVLTTETETVEVITTDVHSAILFKNQTETVTVTEGSVSVPASTVTVTITAP